jgi:hypothetical protein
VHEPNAHQPERVAALSRATVIAGRIGMDPGGLWGDDHWSRCRADWLQEIQTPALARREAQDAGLDQVQLPRLYAAPLKVLAWGADTAR